MPQVERVAGQTETSPSSPLGNEWEFSSGNRWLNPQLYPKEYQGLSQLPRAALEVVNEIQIEYVQSEWEFAALLCRPDESFVTVFVNSQRRDISRRPPHPDVFIKPSVRRNKPQDDFWEGPWSLSGKPIQEVLRGTNLYIMNVTGNYNALELTEPKKWLVRRKPEKVSLYQSGVAYVMVSLETLDEAIHSVDREIEWEKSESERELRRKLDALENRKSVLVRLRAPEPEKFFL